MAFLRASPITLWQANALLYLTAEILKVSKAKQLEAKKREKRKKEVKKTDPKRRKL